MEGLPNRGRGRGLGGGGGMRGARYCDIPVDGVL